MGLFIHIILEIAALFALYWTIRTRKLVPAIVSIVMIAGIILVLYPEIQNKFYGLYVYMGACLVAIIYGVTKLNGNRISAYIIILMSTSMFLHWLWVTQHLQGNTLIFPGIALITGAVGLISRAKLRNELGFLIILSADAIAIIVEQLLK
ncbi:MULTISPECIES: hypothetical protein [unclassified Lentimicrobium]|uniref:hypothetical protein n=1 Tax=unclassified Lentimicrobium TaxID=2677434 RepID=UPI001552D296|nr:MULTISPECIES: hypothetical protein [unclassified Lentimicrobium]NPD44893.1 hypothetical protein [Lentimicrobium sp. S6]NPD83719.1 hypothetical protein [Lentimicrobium sp. L6]